MNIKTFCLALLIAWSGFGAAHAESAYERVIRTGILRCGYTPWPLYFDLDPNTGILTGLSKELTDSIGAILDVKIEYVQTLAGDQVADLKNGKVDAVCGDGPYVLSTIKYLSYSTPYFYEGVFAYGRADDQRFQKLSDLNRASVKFIGMDGDWTPQILKEYFPQASMKTLGNLADASIMLENVANKKTDIALMDPLPVQAFNKTSPAKMKKLFPQVLYVYGVGFSVAKNEPQLLDTLNAAVLALGNSGKSERLLKKYDAQGNLFLPNAKPYLEKR